MLLSYLVLPVIAVCLASRFDRFHCQFLFVDRNSRINTVCCNIVDVLGYRAHVVALLTVSF